MVFTTLRPRSTSPDKFHVTVSMIITRLKDHHFWLAWNCCIFSLSCCFCFGWFVDVPMVRSGNAMDVADMWFFWCRCYRCALNYWDETSHEHLPFGGVPLPMGGKSSIWKNSTHRYCFHMSINLVVVLSLTDSARFFFSSCYLSVSSSTFRFLSITL